MSNELIIKHPNLPLKAYAPDALEKEMDKFMLWINNLLGLRGEESAKRMVLALPAIQKHFYSLGFAEITKAFEMYADGELSIQPRTNYFDRILVGQIFNDYKMYKRQKNPKTMDYDKENSDFLYCVQAFDYFVQNGALPEQAAWLYEYLTDHKGILSVSKREKHTSYNLALDKYENKDVAILKSKIWLVERYFNNLITKQQHIKTEL